MKSEIYTKIKDALYKAGMKNVTLFRVPDQEILSQSPIAMVEFGAVDYEQVLRRVQSVKSTVTIHVLWGVFGENDDLDLLDATQQVYVELDKIGFTRTSEKSRLFDETCIDHQIVFASPLFEDTDAQQDTITIPKPNLLISNE